MRLARFHAVIMVFILFASWARAHDMTPGVLSLVELSPNRYAMVWTPPSDVASSGDDVRIEYPAGCRTSPASSSSSSVLECTSELSSRSVRFDGIRSPRVKIVMNVRWRDGRVFEAIATKEKPEVKVASGTSLFGWARMGIEHVLTGWDHVAFVVGLFLVVGAAPPRRRRLVTTITSFTIAHSITLALASLRVLTVARLPVEATIAASILLVAREALTEERASLTSRYPWAVAFTFGLVHGLGFAGALTDLPLDRGTIVLSLLSFNVGIEAAQIAIVVVLLLLERARSFSRARPVIAYMIGALGAFWFLDRAYLVLKR